MIQQMIEIVISGLEDKKGENIKVIDISEVSPISDYFVLEICKSITLMLYYTKRYSEAFHDRTH